MVTYTLSLRTILEILLESILYIIYFFLISGSQESNASNGLQIRAEMKKLCPFEDNCTKLEGHFEIHFEMTPILNSPTTTFSCSASSTSGIASMQLMNSKSTLKWHQFQIQPLPLWWFASSTSGIVSRALHLP